ncbi:MAG TPA: rhomboid family intramembrane serine protease [bacterium]|nr:rhomboid family intramembrane serine protease [bacterium]HOC24356.1 rhomboid family intramembrane serine protease [bacterium]HOH07742.1 rhomboid family intramembrane serine protease [bacterium]HOY44499.1 rhomboid family intramembrane serine protease [bacterium]HPG82054.1 rhomboid family intramembrane serine protease [bacterium]
MIPIRDDNARHHFPVVTVTLIAANVIVFIYQSLLPSLQVSEFILEYGAVPYYITNGSHLGTIFSSMFLHGGFMHLGGNMLYLFIFGDNIESVLGSLRYLLFYLLCGVAAFASHYLFDLSSQIPMIGASGAISGVLGAYAVRFPHAKVSVLLPLIIIWQVITVPAVLVLGFWFVMQLFSGATGSAQSGGVAWLAHVGGFVAGVLFMLVWKRRHNLGF